MTEYAVQTFSLTKLFKKVPALNDVNINVPKGSIYGLIGRNGAGKTTLIRILTGSAEQTSGYFSINGSNEHKDILAQRTRMGSIIETPTLYTYFSAQQNLIARCILLGISDREQKCNEMLRLVGLENTGNKKVSNFSLGMKQRLALALALLNDPQLLILDEPVNGLDPMGIQQMREMLKEINARGVTIIISSHLLTELSRLATHYGIIENGRLIKEVTEQEIFGSSSKTITIGFHDLTYLSSAVSLLKTRFGEQNLHLINNKLTVTNTTENDVGEITKLFIENGIKFSSVAPSEDALESYFLAAIRGGQNA
jgi:ABC-2 type transport system ATP-binding protein